MAKSKTQSSLGTNLMKLGLNKNQINIFLDSIHEKHWAESLKIYKKLNIIRKDLDTKNEIYALIKLDKKSYDVNLEIMQNSLVSFCNCAHREDSKGCQHIGAILLYKLLKEKNNNFNLKLKKSINKKEKKDNNLDYFKDLFPTETKSDKQNMIYFNFEDFYSDSQLLKIERGVIKKDGSYGAPTKFHGKKFDSHDWKISKNVKKVLDYVSEGDIYGMHSSSVGFSKSKFYDINTDLMMPVLKNLYFEEQELILGAVFSKDSFEINWDIEKLEGNYILEPFFVSGKKKKSLLKMNLFEIGCTSLWVFDNDKRTFYNYKNEENLDLVRKIIRFPKKLVLDEKELKSFFKKYYQKLFNDFEFNVSNDLKRESRAVIPTTKLYLEKSGSTVKIRINFDYAGHEIDYFSKNKEVVIIENDVICDISRDFEQEEEIIDILNENSVVMHEDKDEFTIENELVDFVSVDIPKIVESNILIFGEENLFKFKVIKHKARMNLDIKKNRDWFDFNGTVNFGKESVNIKKVIEAIFQNKRFVELGEGKKAIIPKKWVENIKNYSGFFNYDEDKLKLSKNHLSIMDVFTNLSPGTKMDSKVKSAITKFKEITNVKETKLSKNIKANLRPYQKSGYDWLSFLREVGFNGILADDMGLGKTLQTLSLFQKMKDEKIIKPILVVVPTSLVFNWDNEIKKFTPNLKAYLHHGQKRSKGKKFDESLSENDLVITTYGVLRNDLEIFKKQEFEYIVLDEAHMIKNPVSISAKTVYALNGKNKLVISGTPIQNNLTELWSLFNFLNPGYLGSYDFFRENFVIPIERDNDKNIGESLKKLIGPFLMRRTKKIIANELPEKSEMILSCNLSNEEKEIYNNWKEYFKQEIKNSVKEKGINKSKIKILEGLTKLRQICLHPKMIDTKYTGSAAKFELLMMEIEKIISEGHKVLVFSSFVKMLTIVKEEFEKRGMRYSYLDGKTKNREKVVSRFQDSKEAEAFLISIKAGGVGLNLTSADYVFILDPWWNPAVEMQAMDRAHRIGQKKKVFVYKMIVEETIEDKILKLQKSKKKLVEDLIVEEKSLIKNMGMKDIEDLFH